MGNLRYAVVVAALLVTGSAFAGTVKTLNIQSSLGVVTEVILPSGDHVSIVAAYAPYYRIIPFHSGKGASYRGGIAIIQKIKTLVAT